MSLLQVYAVTPKRPGCTCSWRMECMVCARVRWLAEDVDGQKADRRSRPAVNQWRHVATRQKHFKDAFLRLAYLDEMSQGMWSAKHSHLDAFENSDWGCHA